MVVVRFNGTRAELNTLLARFPGAMAGKTTDSVEREAAKQVATATGNAMLAEIKLDYMRKSEGAKGQDGVTWSPLMPATIRAKARKALKARGMGKKTDKGIAYRTRLAEYEARLATAKSRLSRATPAAPVGNATAQALRRKDIERRARTIVGTFPHEIRPEQNVRPFALTLILIDTAIGINSLSAGIKYKRYTGPNANEQLFIAVPGEVIVGTKVPYMSSHQHGRPGRHLPARPFLPTAGNIPAEWWSRVKATTANAMADALKWIIQGSVQS